MKIPTLKEVFLTERTLYHGTIIDHKKSIEDFGVKTSVGDWVMDSYRIGFDSDFTEEEVGEALGGITFAADKEEMDKAVGAMTFHIAKKLGKDYGDVTLEDIKNHGMLVIFKEIDDKEALRQPEDKEDTGWFRHPKDMEDISFYAQHPISVEPGDYYFKSEDGDAIGFDNILTGNKMIDFLRRNGALKYFDEDKKRELIKLAIKYYKNKRTRQEIINKVNQLSPERIRSMLATYQRLLKK